MTATKEQIQDILDWLTRAETEFENITKYVGYPKEVGSSDFFVTHNPSGGSLTVEIRSTGTRTGLSANSVGHLAAMLINIASEGKTKIIADCLRPLLTDDGGTGNETPTYQTINDDLVAKLKAMILTLNTRTTIS